MAGNFISALGSPNDPEDSPRSFSDEAREKVDPNNPVFVEADGVAQIEQSEISSCAYEIDDVGQAITDLRDNYQNQRAA